MAIFRGGRVTGRKIPAPSLHTSSPPMMSDVDDNLQLAMLDIIEKIAAVMDSTDPESERLETI